MHPGDHPHEAAVLQRVDAALVDPSAREVELGAIEQRHCQAYGAATRRRIDHVAVDHVCARSHYEVQLLAQAAARIKDHVTTSASVARRATKNAASEA